MSEEVEALAREMHDKAAKARGLNLWDWDDDTAPSKAIYRERARAVIAARSFGAGDEGLVMVAALFVEPEGIYVGLPNVDAWDETRDARGYGGPHPVVAHPPCDRWNMLSAVNNARWGYVINQDGGCFAAALGAVRKWGGVLEHPAETRAFKFHRIPEPAPGHWQLTLDGDWVTEVNQAAYGHRARKRTWLLYRGDAPPPPLDWRDVKGTHRVGFGFPDDTDRPLPRIKQTEALATPPAFRDLLLTMARSVHEQKERAA